MIKVMVADDHRLIRNGIKSFLKQETSVSIVGEAENGKKLVQMLNNTEVDVILMDIKMPEMDGFDTTKHIVQHFKSVKILALSMFESEEYINKMLQVGALGYILKNITREELIHAITQISRGQPYIASEITVNFLKKNAGKKVTYPSSEGMETSVMADLSKRELEVLKLIGEGLTNGQIAEKLFTSKRTIDSHRKRIIEKTQAKNSAALIKLALKNGIIW